MGAGPTRALTGGRRTKPTSTGCRRLRQPEPGRRSTYQAGEPVQTNRASSEHGSAHVHSGEIRALRDLVEELRADKSRLQFELDRASDERSKLLEMVEAKDRLLTDQREKERSSPTLWARLWRRAP